MTEPDAGSDPGSMRTTAVKKGDHWVLNGSKTWISNSPIADIAVVWAMDPDAGRIRGFVVERGMENGRVKTRCLDPMSEGDDEYMQLVSTVVSCIVVLVFIITLYIGIRVTRAVMSRQTGGCCSSSLNWPATQSSDRLFIRGGGSRSS